MIDKVEEVEVGECYRVGDTVHVVTGFDEPRDVVCGFEGGLAVGHIYGPDDAPVIYWNCPQCLTPNQKNLDPEPDPDRYRD